MHGLLLGKELLSEVVNFAIILRNISLYQS